MMPMQWVDPARAYKVDTKRGEVEVFHTYKQSDYQSTYYFTLLSCYDDVEGDGNHTEPPCIFDIRDLDGYDHTKTLREQGAALIASALNAGKLPHPDDIDY